MVVESYRLDSALQNSGETDEWNKGGEQVEKRGAHREQSELSERYAIVEIGHTLSSAIDQRTIPAACKSLRDSLCV